MILYSIFFIASVIIHEFGHYLFGKILRFKFDYIVLFGVCIYKENNKLKGSDSYNIIKMFNKYYFLNKITAILKSNNIPSMNFPHYYFNLIIKEKITENNIKYYKYLYLRYLEMGKIGLAKKTFNNLYKLLLNSNYLSDKAEILYFYIFIQPDAIICDL